MPPTDLSSWLTRPEACEFLGVAPKTIERYEGRGILHQRKRPTIGKKPLSVYDPEELQRIKDELTPHTPAIIVNDLPPVAVAIKEAAVKKAAVNGFDVMIGKALAAVVSETARVRVSEKIYLTIREASELSGLPMAEIRRMIANDVLRGQLQAKRLGSGWRIRRDCLATAV